MKCNGKRAPVVMQEGTRGKGVGIVDRSLKQIAALQCCKEEEYYVHVNGVENIALVIGFDLTSFPQC